MTEGYEDRRDAGRQLAERVADLSLDDPVVLGLPRGGVPVAAEVADRLGAPLGVVVVRKVGAPSNPEYGVGAPDNVDRVGAHYDEVVAPRTPEGFRAVGMWYRDFTQTSDEEVVETLRAHGHASGRVRSADPRG